MKILFVTTTKYPELGAETLRLHHIAKLFQHNGYEVRVASRGETGYLVPGEYDGIRYVSLRKDKGAAAPRLLRGLDLFLYTRRLKRYVGETKFDAFMILGAQTSSLKYIKKYALKNGCPLYHDSVEWYSPEQFKRKKRALAYRAKELWMNKLLDSSFNIIAISTYLENYFKSLSCKTVRIPVIMDMEKIPFNKRTVPEKVVFLYAGKPDRKDYLDVMLAGFASLDEDMLESVVIKIIGATADSLKSGCGVSDETLGRLGGHLEIIGRVPHAEVIDNILAADFTMLMRSEELRYARAGFPTKVVESLAAGTPVICNVTSDLGMYIRSGENGILVEGCTAGQFAAAVKKAVAMRYEDRVRMQANARKTAEEFFDYRAYTEKIKEIL